MITFRNCLKISLRNIREQKGHAGVRAGKHYPPDVIAGSVAGFAIGHLVPTLHKKKKDDRLSIIISLHRIGFCLKL
jgi:hypothetical protein